MAVERVTYGVGGWGVGELLYEDGTLLHHELPRPGPQDDNPRGTPLVDRLRTYFRGDPAAFDDVALDLSWTTPFQLAVAEALRAVSFGELVTYGELAALAGHPNAQRAAGSFCARNRFPVIVPCHRVVSSTGLGSYGSLGQDYKRRLLALEGLEV